MRSACVLLVCAVGCGGAATPWRSDPVALPGTSPASRGAAVPSDGCSGAAVALATVDATPLNLRVVGADLYFSNDGTRGALIISRVSTGGGDARALVTSDGGLGFAADGDGLYIARGGGVDFYDGDGNFLRSVLAPEIGGCSVTTSAVTVANRVVFAIAGNGGNGGGVAVDSACTSGGGIVAIPAGADRGTLLARTSDDDGGGDTLALSADGERVYWSDTRGVWSVPAGGGAVTQLSATPSGRLVSDGGSLYFGNDGGVFRGARGAVTRLGPLPFDLGSDDGVRVFGLRRQSDGISVVALGNGGGGGLDVLAGDAGGDTVAVDDRAAYWVADDGRTILRGCK